MPPFGWGLGLPPPSGLANPKGLANCVLWLRGDLGVTLGTGVSTWADQSVSGTNFTQATGATQPTYTNSMNGHSVLTFSGSQWLTRTAISLGSSGASFTVAFAFRTSSTASSAAGGYDQPITAIGDSNGSKNGSWGVKSGHAASSMYNGSSYIQTTGTATVNGNTPHSSISVQSASSVANYTDGVADGTGTVTSSTPGLDSIGRGFNTSDSWVGDIGEIVLYTRALSATEIAQLAAYFRGFWATP